MTEGEAGAGSGDAAADPARLYTAQVRDLAARVRVDRALPAPDGAAEATGRICGSRVRIETALEPGAQSPGGPSPAPSAPALIRDIGWRVRGCLLTMAATAVVVQAARGATPGDIAAGEAALRGLLAGSADPLPDRWADLTPLAAAQSFPERHGSLFLPFEALASALAAALPGTPAGPQTRRISSV